MTSNPEVEDARLPPFVDRDGVSLLLFGGKGGVGKTTCAVASALGLARASPGRSLLLVSTDPAHSVTDSLGGAALPDNLDVLELDAPARLEEFKRDHGDQLHQIASRGTFLDDDDVRRLLDLSLPGLDELMAFFEIAGWVEEARYSCLVVDTAPTGHTLRLLGMAEVIRSWLRALDALLAKHRYMKRLYQGFYQRDELDELLLGLSGSVEALQALLRDERRCRFVPVLLAEALVIEETGRLLAELERLEIPVRDLVVNRLYPAGCPLCRRRRWRQLAELADLPWAPDRYSLWAVPVYPAEVRGRQALATFWGGSTVIEESPPVPGAHGPLPSPRVEGAMREPSGDLRLIVFGGKGGVGKTTLACATAVRLAGAGSGREVLLFSSDPAHSLSACLEVEIGARPTAIAPGLAALQIDAEAELEELSREYRDEVSQLLGALSPNVDLAFDRAVMERLMDLAPPGLDEVLALSLEMELLAAGTFDVLVLDSAPTGHLVRLLEMPELVDRWLKVLFDLLLKYRTVLRLPRVSERLVGLSKDLKQLRRLMGDGGRSALYAVTIATGMALEETADLVAASERLGLRPAGLLVNLATPPSDCSLCSALVERERRVLEEMRTVFAQTPRSLVYLGQEPRGLERLGELGTALYRRHPGPPERGAG